MSHEEVTDKLKGNHPGFSESQKATFSPGPRPDRDAVVSSQSPTPPPKKKNKNTGGGGTACQTAADLKAEIITPLSQLFSSTRCELTSG